MIKGVQISPKKSTTSPANMSMNHDSSANNGGGGFTYSFDFSTNHTFHLQSPKGDIIDDKTNGDHNQTFFRSPSHPQSTSNHNNDNKEKEAPSSPKPPLTPRTRAALKKKKVIMKIAITIHITTKKKLMV